MFEYYCNNLLCVSKYEYNDLHKCLLGSSSPQRVDAHLQTDHISGQGEVKGEVNQFFCCGKC